MFKTCMYPHLLVHLPNFLVASTHVSLQNGDIFNRRLGLDLLKGSGIYSIPKFLVLFTHLETSLAMSTLAVTGISTSAAIAINSAKLNKSAVYLEDDDFTFRLFNFSGKRYPRSFISPMDLFNVTPIAHHGSSVQKEKE